MPVRALSFTFLAVATAGLAGAADWPQWRGPNRDGVSTEKGLLDSWPKGGPPLVWKKETVGFGYSAPVVVGDKLFIGGADDKSGENEFLLCLNTKNGEQIWKTPLPFGQKGYGDTSRGNGPRGSPTVDGDHVYVLGARGDLSCLKTADGGKVWSVNYVSDFGGSPGQWGYSESVLVDGDHVIATPGGGKAAMVALDKKTGKEVWRCTDFKDSATYSSPVIVTVGGVKQYVTQTQQAAVGVRASDGKMLWRVDQLRRAIAVIPTAVVQDNYVFFTAGYRAGCELLKLEPDGSGGTKAEVVYTKNPLVQNHHGGVVRVGDYIYGHSDSKGWVCFDFKKGGEEPVWAEKKLGKGSVTFADGHLYCYSESGGEVALVEASPGGWKEKGRFTIPEKETPRPGGAIWTHPVIADGKLYLRDHHHLFCYDVRRPGA
jgi:outer membrane protein assembly factor BamB